MIVRFWGARGSLPAPGANTSDIGGNTACVSVEVEGHVLVLDAGTGIRELGESLAGKAVEITILTTHLHLDHIIGLPFFAPLYEAGRTINFTVVRSGGTARSPLDIMDGIYFPRHQGELPSNCRIVHDEVGFLGERGFSLECLDLNHPGGATGFKISRGGKALAYLTDNELGGSEENRSRFGDFVAFTERASLLCHDAQYQAVEIEGKQGRGHSTVEEACELAIQAQVEHLVLFHHDPARDDASIREIERRAQGLCEPHGIRCTAAFEGLKMEL